MVVVFLALCLGVDARVGMGISLAGALYYRGC